MNKKRTFWMICGIILIIICMVLGLYFMVSKNHQEEPAPEEETGERVQVIDVSLLNYNEEPVRLSDYIGKPIILNFWATWCPNCVHEFPSFEQLHAEYGDKVQFMMIDIVDGQDETVEIAKQFIEENNFHFPVYFDTQLEAATVYQANAIPLTYLIDKDGYVVAYGRGAMDYDTLKNAIEKYLISE